ncbi:MAG: hypothetical protein JXA25_13880 [Anaerolineales bacterium]|nr:hypothetical protein [Anaerolineales bacterium]
MFFNKLLSLILRFLMVALSLQPAVLIPVSAGDSPTSDPSRALPSLSDFIKTVTVDSSDDVVGVYVEDLFALAVIQQPASQPGYVSPSPDTITQFALAEDYGTIGLLAHNFAAGDLFFELDVGMELILVFGDSTLKRYQISNTASYQAMDPDNTHSTFRDLTDQHYLSATELFEQVYQNPGDITFQTCIAQDGNSSWGRYFVNATPLTESPASGEYYPVDESGFVSW